MAALLLDGKKLASEIQNELTQEVLGLKTRGIVPLLAVLMIEGDESSEVYVKNKVKRATEIGIQTIVEKVKESEFDSLGMTIIKKWNEDEKIHGIIVQIPEKTNDTVNNIAQSVVPEKDVDCLSPYNIGLLEIGKAQYYPPTPAGIRALLSKNNISSEGKHVVIVSRSQLVGKALALMMLEKNEKGNATVTVCHSKTRNLAEFTSKADILIVAIGKPEFLSKEHIKENSVIVDVGINKTTKGLVGDFKHDEVESIVSAITPVPGGVGPMTVIMLLKNLVEAAKLKTK